MREKTFLISGRFMIGQYMTVHGDVISHVNISHVDVEDGGEYTCRAENRAGKVSHSARLNIYGKIFIFIMRKTSAELRRYADYNHCSILASNISGKFCAGIGLCRFHYPKLILILYYFV